MASLAPLRRRIAAIGVGCLFLVTACAADPPGGTPSNTAPPQITSQAPVCPNRHGGRCLGTLDGGTYTTVSFQPTLTYTVPSGWDNAEDLPGNFWLYRSNDSQDSPRGGSYVGVYQGLRAAPQTCGEFPDPAVGTDPTEMVRWAARLPGVDASAISPVSIGGLSGQEVTLRLRPGASLPCAADDVDDFRFLPVVVGGGVSQLHHVLLPQMTMRLIVLDWNATNVAIEITSVDEQASAEAYAVEVAPIVASLQFA